MKIRSSNRSESFRRKPGENLVALCTSFSAASKIRGTTLYMSSTKTRLRLILTAPRRTLSNMRPTASIALSRSVRPNSFIQFECRMQQQTKNSSPKLGRGGFANREARARAKRKRDSAQPQEIGRSLKRSERRRGGSKGEPPRLRFARRPPNLGGEF